MVVLAASICTRGGKAILSRQFRDLSKDRITALLANFPSLLSESVSTVEDENVRYVYQPLEELYIVLITNKQSNILQDIDTLHLFGQMVSSMLRSVDEREIFDNAFEILSSFDEIINLGYKENLTLPQIESFLEMDSHEEKIQEIIERNKEFEANEERKRRAKEIQRKELARRNQDQFPSSNNNSFSQDSYPKTYQAPVVPEIPSPQPSTPLSRQAPKGRGLQLGKKSNKPDHQPLLAQESGNSVFQTRAAAAVQANYSAPAPVSKSVPVAPVVPTIPNNGILILVNEKVAVQIARDGSVESSEVKGDLNLRINETEYSDIKVLLQSISSKDGITYKTHPNVDRNLFNSSSIIGLKQGKTFPTNDQSIGVLRWKANGGADDTKFVPLTISCWLNPSANAGFIDVTVEYELNSQFKDPLKNVKLIIPLDLFDSSSVKSEETAFELTEEGVVFEVESIDPEDPQGSFEFSIEAPEEDSLFPIQVEFELEDQQIILGKVQVTDVVSNNEEEESLPFDLKCSLVAEGYNVL